MAEFAKTERTRMRRKHHRATYDRDIIHAIFDEALTAAVAVAIDGQAHVQPMIHCRLDDRLILHGLATNRLLGAIADGAEACINVTLIDALAIARKIEDHSMLYRSATVYGRGRLVEGEAEKLKIMERVFESLVGSGRFEALPPLELGYLGGTMVVEVPIAEAVGKVNDHVETGDGADAIWSGLVPVRLDFGTPVPDERTMAEGVAPSAHLSHYTRRSGR